MTDRLLILILALSGVLGTLRNARCEGEVWNGLPHFEQRELLAGKTVEFEENVDESVWPRFIIYHLVKASPSAVAAVFWNCEKDPEYIPNCTSVKILDSPEKGVVIARYTLSMPFFLPDEVYISRNQLKKLADKDYDISWKVTQSRYSKSSIGSLRVEEHDGMCLIRYTNLVIPSSRFAGMLRNSAGRQVMESVKALVAQILLEQGKTPELLAKQVLALDQAVGKQQ
jgi:ribosome-associated toxin RatA of RatAB toxin-antitoxin module